MSSQRNVFSSHLFTNIADLPFCVKEYSRLKFGDDAIAMKFGYDLADGFFQAHSDIVIGQQLLVCASPYNYVANAATLVTRHFIDRLNHHSVKHAGKAVEYSLIHRKISYVNDYGFLSADKRKALIEGDSFSVNTDFFADKTMVFIDDVRITGTHECKLHDVLTTSGLLTDKAFYLYHAVMVGEGDPAVEAELNFAGLKSVDDFVRMVNDVQHQMIVRPIKYIMGFSQIDVLLDRMSKVAIRKAYHGALAEGYFKIPQYQRNFAALQREFSRM